jgi:hypothetical protein
MTQQEIIEMAKEAGFQTIAGIDVIEFAKLVAAKERERISQKIAQLPFGDTAQSLSIWVKNDT